MQLRSKCLIQDSIGTKTGRATVGILRQLRHSGLKETLDRRQGPEPALCALQRAAMMSLPSGQQNFIDGILKQVERGYQQTALS